MKKNILKIIILILSMLILSIPNSIFKAMVLLLTYILIYKSNNLNKRESILLFFYAWLFSSSQIIGYNCSQFDSALLNNINTYLNTLGLLPIIYILSSMIIKIPFEKKRFNTKLINTLLSSKYSFFILTALIFLLYLPIILSFYPGNFSYDAGTQMRMIKFDMLSKYHPIIHTLFLYLTIYIPQKITSSYEIGVFIHSIVQSLIMSSIFAYTIVYINKKQFPKVLSMLFIIIYSLLPTHVIFSMTTTKDILFSGIFNLAIIKFIELTTNTEQFLHNKKEIISTIIILFLLLSFRNNMIYAFILSSPYILIIMKKHIKQILFIILGSIFLFKLYDLTLTKSFKIENGPRIEMFSFVVQQFARVYTKEQLTEYEKKYIEKLFLNDSLKKYNSHISDPIKSNFSSEELLSNKKKYLKLYISLLKKYPLTYIDSLLDNTFSFYYLKDKLPDPNTKTYIEVSTIDTNNNTIQVTYTRKNNNKIYKTYYNLVSNAKYQKVPILNILMNMSVYVLLMIFVGFIVIIKKQYKLFIPILLLITYLLTILIAPVALTRYAYPFFTTMPLYIFILYKTININNKKLKKNYSR